MQLDKVTHAVSRETFGPLYFVTWCSRLGDSGFSSLVSLMKLFSGCCWLGACLLGPTSVLEGSLGESYGDGDAGWAPLSLLGASFSPLALSSKGESPVLSGRATVVPLASSPS